MTVLSFFGPAPVELVVQHRVFGDVFAVVWVVALVALFLGYGFGGWDAAAESVRTTDRQRFGHRVGRGY